MAKAKKETSIASKTDNMFTAAQLERMTTHELADMLSNMALLLRRMPDAPCGELVTRPETTTQVVPASSPVTIATSTVVEPQQEQDTASTASSQLSLQDRIAELEGKKYTVAKLQVMADNLGIPYPVKPKKADLAKRIAERQMRGHSEQYAMMNL